MRFLTINGAGGSENARVDAQASLFARLVREQRPDVVLFQEAMRQVSVAGLPPDLRDVDSYDPSEEGDLLGAIQQELRGHGYRIRFAPAILSHRDSPPLKWSRVSVPPGHVRAQGCALAIGAGVRCANLWSGELMDHAVPVEQHLPLPEDVDIYAGNRDSEPRLAQGLRLRKGGLDVILWNVHLTTLTGEREGQVDRDLEGLEVRRRQLGILLRAHARASERGQTTDWIIGGDFNCDAAALQEMTEGTGFRVTVDAPTRPHGGRTDNFLVAVGKDRPVSQARVLVPAGFSLAGFASGTIADESQAEVLGELVKAGLDHLPVVIECTD